MNSRLKLLQTALFLILVLCTVSCFESTWKGTNQNDPVSVKKRGYQLLKKGKAKKAMQVFKFGSEKWPGNPDMRIGWGKAGAAHNQKQLAIREYRHACWIAYRHPEHGKKYKHFKALFTEVYYGVQANSKNPGFVDYVVGSPQLGQLGRIQDSLSQSEMSSIAKAIDLFKLRNRRVPRNLNELVKSGIIGQQSLQDQFGRPLYSTFKNGTLYVQYGGADMVMETRDDKVYEYR